MYLYFALYKYVPTTILQLFTYYSTTYYYVVWILSTDFNYSTDIFCNKSTRINVVKFVYYYYAQIIITLS